MSDAIEGDPVERTLKDRADLYGFLGRALVEELDETMLESLVASDDSQLESLEAEAADVGAEPLDGSEKLQAFREEIHDLEDAEREELLQDLDGSYGRLFHMNTSKSVTPYESYYRNGGKLFQESYTQVKKIMKELGYEGFEDHSEPADHAGFELEFMAFLSRGALSQYQDGNVEYATRYLNLQAEFLEAHISKWVPKLCAEIAEKTDSEFYQGVAQIAGSLIEEDPEMIETLQKELAAR